MALRQPLGDSGGKGNKKTKPDSLTNQGLPGLNTANLCRFL